MASHSTFLSLPREMRNNIYERYVEAEGGYVCNSESIVTRRLNQNRASENSTHLSIAGILKRADGRPTDLSLAYTCKLVAQEMYGIALRTNTITFSTVSSDEIRIVAARFGHGMRDLDSTRCSLFGFGGHAMPERANEELKRRYPQFAPILDRLREEVEGGVNDPRYRLLLSIKGPYGEAPSLYRTFCKEALEAVLLSQIGHETMNRFWVDCLGMKPRHAASHDVLPEIRCPVEHWAIPSKHEMNLVSSEKKDGLLVYDVTKLKDPTKYSFSATAVAIHFLQSLPVTLRVQLRRIFLNEDREAVAKPECHALGLIPFCKENPLLHVERRVNLWTNAFHPDNNYRSSYLRCKPKIRYTPWELDSNQITLNLSQWIVEALALVPAGMPAESFSLVLDGQPVPQLCTQIFQLIVQRDAAWQAAWVESLNRGILPALSWFDRKCERQRLWEDYRGFFFEDFPRALRDMANGNSIVRCNFDIGETWDVEKIIREHRSWTSEQWNEAWGEHEPETWETVAPLPPWRRLIEDAFILVAGTEEDESSSSEEWPFSSDSSDSSDDE